MDASAIRIRRARAGDVPAMVGLLVQLGYTPQEDWVRTWVITASPDDRCLVAEIGSRVVGLAHVHRVPFLTESAYKARLTALVVDEADRSRGVGALLLEAAEQATRDMGATVLELSTSKRRQRAHRFYERHGYTRPSRHYRKAVVPRVSAPPDDGPLGGPGAVSPGA
ncbi:GNAT family N-acetyltransferase [Kocuria sabuli]|uniref:GNAT family N-acetyltransferase n=1 Tax=Kocuria sabuli TaxID=3071448 RepID=UPI0034D612F5